MSSLAERDFDPRYQVARCGQLATHAPHVVDHGPDQPRNCPGTGRSEAQHARDMAARYGPLWDHEAAERIAAAALGPDDEDVRRVQRMDKAVGDCVSVLSLRGWEPLARELREAWREYGGEGDG